MILALLLITVSYAGLAGGQAWVSVGDIWIGLTDPSDFLIRVIRLPRLLTAMGAGMALGLAGALMQALTRNPLATPDVIGLVQAAGLGHVAALIVGVAPLFGAFGGVVVAIAILALLARDQGPLAVVLYGIGIGATCAAATAVLLLRATDAQAASALIWLSGGLARSDASTALALWWVVLPALVVVLAFAHRLSTLWLGDEMIQSLGGQLSQVRGLVLALVAVLTAAATLAVGPIGFLAFAAAPLAMAVTRTEPPALFPAALMGGCLLVFADLVARSLASVVSLPTGLVMSVLAAPYLIFYLWQEKRRFAL